MGNQGIGPGWANEPRDLLDDDNVVGDRDTIMMTGGRLVDYEQVFAAGGAGGVTQNLFQVTGQVEVHAMWAEVETVLSAGITAVVLELMDDVGPQPITAGAPALSSLPVGSGVFRDNTVANALGVQSAVACAVVDPVVSGLFEPFRLFQKTGGVATYIRMSYTAGGVTSGALHWYIVYHELGAGSSIVAV